MHAVYETFSKCPYFQKPPLPPKIPGCAPDDKSVLISSLTGFDIAFTNVETKLKQHRDKVVSTLFQGQTPMLYQRCATLKTRRRILIHNVETTLIRR